MAFYPSKMNVNMPFAVIYVSLSSWLFHYYYYYYDYLDGYNVKLFDVKIGRHKIEYMSRVATLYYIDVDTTAGLERQQWAYKGQRRRRRWWKQQKDKMREPSSFCAYSRAIEQ